jgi:hypothetical protein
MSRASGASVAAGVLAIGQGFLVGFLALILSALAKMDSGVIRDDDRAVVFAVAAVGVLLMIVGIAAAMAKSWALSALIVVEVLVLGFGVAGLTRDSGAWLGLAVFIFAPAAFVIIGSVLALRRRGKLAT